LDDVFIPALSFRFWRREGDILELLSSLSAQSQLISLLLVGDLTGASVTTMVVIVVA
jgi:hypothetical protein